MDQKHIMMAERIVKRVRIRVRGSVGIGKLGIMKEIIEIKSRSGIWTRWRYSRRTGRHINGWAKRWRRLRGGI